MLSVAGLTGAITTSTSIGAPRVVVGYRRWSMEFFVLDGIEAVRHGGSLKVTNLATDEVLRGFHDLGSLLALARGVPRVALTFNTRGSQQHPVQAGAACLDMLVSPPW